MDVPNMDLVPNRIRSRYGNNNLSRRDQINLSHRVNNGIISHESVAACAHYTLTYPIITESIDANSRNTANTSLKSTHNRVNGSLGTSHTPHTPKHRRAAPKTHQTPHKHQPHPYPTKNSGGVPHKKPKNKPHQPKPAPEQPIPGSNQYKNVHETPRIKTQTFTKTLNPESHSKKTTIPHSKPRI